MDSRRTTRLDKSDHRRSLRAGHREERQRGLGFQPETKLTPIIKRPLVPTHDSGLLTKQRARRRQKRALSQAGSLSHVSATFVQGAL